MDILSKKLSRIFQNVNDWLKFAEAKNAVLLAFSGAGITATLTVLVSSDKLPNSLQRGFIVVTILLCICALFCTISFLPKTNLDKILSIQSNWFQSEQPQPEDNLYFFGHLRKYKTLQLLDRLDACYLDNATPKPYSKEAQDLALQVIINSEVAFEKFQVFTCAIYTLIVAILFIPLFVLISL
jgi:hypothetical protein